MDEHGLSTTKVPRALEMKTKLLGFELPDLQDAAVQTVLQQAEVLRKEWVPVRGLVRILGPKAIDQTEKYSLAQS